MRALAVVALAVGALLPAAAPARTDVAPAPATLVAVGDIASCDSSGDEATAALVDRIPGTVALLGDTVYEEGSAEEYKRCFEPSWGRHKARTRPAVGNHEYGTEDAAGYFGYFGAAAAPPNGWYSYDLGAWHVVVLNSNCDEVGGCERGSRQERWLRADLARNPARCTLAYMHAPRFSSGMHGSEPELHDLWRALALAGAEIVLAGHDHNYERFSPRGPAGRTKPLGLRQFVVGTGGKSLRSVKRRAHGSQVVANRRYGVLVLRLGESGYSWRFVAAPDRKVLDAGASACR